MEIAPLDGNLYKLDSTLALAVRHIALSVQVLRKQLPHNTETIVRRATHTKFHPFYDAQ
jgi:hypothetical protein